MKGTTSLPQRLISALAALLFLWAAGPDAYGSRPCPHHAPASAAASAASATHPDGDLSGAGHRHGDPSHGPCTCVDSCHSSTVVAVGPRAAGILVDGVPSFRPLAAPHAAIRPWGSRHSAYELPLPNAPPVLA